MARKVKKRRSGWKYHLAALTGRTDETVEYDHFDYHLLVVVIVLTCFGLILLYSSSAYEAFQSNGDDMVYFRRQAIISAITLCIAIAGALIDYHNYAKVSGVVYLLAIVLMAMVPAFGIEVNGAKRWLKIGIQFQPSEIAKVAVILLLPYLIVKIGRYIRKWQAGVSICILGTIPAICAYKLTDNLSTGLIILGISVGILFIAHPNTKFFVVAFVVAMIVVLIALYLIIYGNVSGGFRITRIQVWLHPEDYASGSGYQILQALYAIGNGGFFGKGLGNSTQKLGSLPEAQNDMIFSIICEELGMFGAILVIVLYIFLLSRLYYIARRAPDLLGSLIVCGIFIHIALQVILNIAVVTNKIPTTGITLPFISYGGTSILFLNIEVALALSVSRRIRTSG